MTKFTSSKLTREATLQASSKAPEQVSQPEDARKHGSYLLGLTGLLFMFLQSLCTAVVAISGVRLAIGLGSFAAATGISSPILAFHADRYRIPMIAIAVLGSCINLYVIWRIRSLRGRVSARWRATPLDPKQKRAETIQIALAMLTLLLTVLELGAHRALHGQF